VVESRILIVENDEALRQKLYRGMLDVDLFSDCATDARQAIELLSQRAYSIIILDLAVAGGSDVVLAAVQRMPNAERPIVLGTAESDHLTRVEAEGIQVVIRRPLRVREITELTRACIDASAQRRRKAGSRDDELRA
jgi:DNA-binding NtrC family response regulator